MNKSDELHDWVAENKPLVVGLVETWLCKDILDSEFVPEGYICFRCDRIESKRGGGVCLLIRSDIPTTQIRAFADPDGQFESVWCKLKLTKSGHDVLGIIYRTPGTSGDHLLNELEFTQRYGRCLLLGDMNTPHIDWLNWTCQPGAEHLSRRLLDKCLELGLHQHVLEPTRILQDQQSTLDLILSTNQSDVQNLKFHNPLGKSDHLVLTFQWNRNVTVMASDSTRRNVWKINFPLMLDAARSESWPDDYDDPERSWNFLKSTIQGLTVRFSPVQKPRPHSKGPPWFDFDLRQALRRRNRTWKHYRNTGEGYDNYKRIRNSCTAMKRQ